MSENNVGKLYARIAKVSKSIGSLAPDARNQDQKYDYISADKILERVGRAMADEGLVVAPSITAEACDLIEYESYGKKKSRYDAILEFDMLIADADGNMVTQHWISRGTDYVTPDKALFKAITSGHKYFLMKLFNVGVGNEDGEHEAPPDEIPTQRDKRGETSPQAQAKRQRPQPPTQNENGDGDVDHMQAAQKATSLKEFAAHAYQVIDGYDSPEHIVGAITRKLYPDGFVYDAKSNNEYLSKLADRKAANE